MVSDLPRGEPKDPILRDVPLAPLTTLGVGGAARWFARAASADDVAAIASRHDGPLLTLGGGSNLVVADEGFDGLVLQVGIEGVDATPDGSDVIVTAGAGTVWDSVVNYAVAHALAGLECLSGIPGTVGGTPVQNVGAYGQEVSSVIESVRAFDLVAREAVSFSPAECRFAYRMSRFKQDDAGRFVICHVGYRLCRGGAPTVTYRDVVEFLTTFGIVSPDLADVRHAVLTIRRGKGMVMDTFDPDTRSVGSFFMNPIVDRSVFEWIAPAPHYLMDNDTVKIPAAWLIEQSGFRRGHVDGAVGLSSKHPLAIINRGGADARDVLRLASRIKRTVMDRFGVTLRPEPVFVGFRDDDPDVAYLRG